MRASDSVAACVAGAAGLQGHPPSLPPARGARPDARQADAPQTDGPARWRGARRGVRARAPRRFRRLDGRSHAASQPMSSWRSSYFRSAAAATGKVYRAQHRAAPRCGATPSADGVWTGQREARTRVTSGRTTVQHHPLPPPSPPPPLPSAVLLQEGMLLALLDGSQDADGWTRTRAERKETESR